MIDRSRNRPSATGDCDRSIDSRQRLETAIGGRHRLRTSIDAGVFRLDSRNRLRQITRRGWLQLGLGGVVASSGRVLGRGRADDGDESSEGAHERSIRDENERSGDDGWRPQTTPSSRPTEITYLVGGYTAQTSVEPGETLEFLVSTEPAHRYRIDVYRLGWYDGAGGRHVTSVPSVDDASGGDGDDELPGESQPIPDPDPETGLVACDWDVTATLEVPEEWLSGLYVARFVLTDGEHAGVSTAHPFVVRPHPDRCASALVQLPLATEQAYNGWGGKSLYDHTSDGTAADVVSHDRPYTGELTFHTNYAVHFLRFVEREGYDVAYVCDTDVHRDPEMLQEYELAISAGHDEYWSRPQRLGFEEARDTGTNLAFVGANIAYWQVRYEDDERTMVCYKQTVEDDPVQDEHRSGLFRDVDLPECELLGVQGWGAGLQNFPDYAVQEEGMDHPWMADTGFEAGDEIVAVVGPEWDWVRPECDVSEDLTRFFHHEEGTSDLEIERPADADCIVYTAASGARVFSTGTIAYTSAIDPDPDWNEGWPYVQVRAYEPGVAEPDPRLQRFTQNALEDLLEE